MANKLKQSCSYITYIAVAILNFIFMGLGYAVFYASAGSYGSSESLNAYKCMSFGDESLKNLLDQFMYITGEGSKLTFLGVLIAIMMILMIVVNVVLIVAGIVGLVRVLAKKNLVPHMGKQMLDKSSGIVFTAGAAISVVSALFLILMSLCNNYKESLFESTIKAGMRPGVGMYLILVLFVGSWVADLLVFKKLGSKKAAASYVCSECGSVASKENAFCGKCGGKVVEVPAEVEGNEASEESADEVTDFNYKMIGVYCKNGYHAFMEFLEKSNVSKKSLKTVGAALGTLIVLLLIVTIIPWPKPSMFNDQKSGYMFAYDDKEDITNILENGKLRDEKIDGSVYQVSSLDGKTAAIYGNKDKTLYVLTSKGLTKIAEDATVAGYSSYLASIAYTDSEGVLYLYNVAKKNAEKITDKLYTEKSTGCVVSPDGKTILYTKTLEQEDDNGNTETSYALYLNVKGKESKVGNKLVPLGVSDNGKLIYFYSAEKDSVYVQKKGKEAQKIASETNGYSIRMMFNADYTEVLYNANGWYISANGNEKVKLASGALSTIGGIEQHYEIFQTNKSTICVIPVDTFVKQYILTESGEFSYINKKYETVKLYDDVSSYLTTASNDTVYVKTKDDSLYRSEGYKSNFKKVADDVESFVITSDGEKCYYTNDDDALMYVKGTGKAKKIADDVDALAITADDHVLFLCEVTKSGGTLYSSKNGGKKKLISEDVKDFVVHINIAAYEIAGDNDTSDFYVAVKGVKFKKILSY